MPAKKKAAAEKSPAIEKAEPESKKKSTEVSTSSSRDITSSGMNSVAEKKPPPIKRPPATGKETKAQPKAKLNVAYEKVSKFSFLAYPGRGSYSQIGIKMQEASKFIETFKSFVKPPPFVIFYNDPFSVKEENLLWDWGFPLANPVKATPPLLLKEFADSLVAKTTLVGPYKSLAENYPLIWECLRNDGYRVSGPFVESYVDDPMEVNESQIRTEVWIVVEKSGQ